MLLAGDAAHIHFPTGGAGLNTGVQDAPASSQLFAQMHDGRPVLLSGDLPGAGWRDAQAVLVRPDGYVGWASAATSSSAEAAAVAAFPG